MTRNMVMNPEELRRGIDYLQTIVVGRTPSTKSNTDEKKEKKKKSDDGTKEKRKRLQKPNTYKNLYFQLLLQDAETIVTFYFQNLINERNDLNDEQKATLLSVMLANEKDMRLKSDVLLSDNWIALGNLRYFKTENGQPIFGNPAIMERPIKEMSEFKINGQPLVDWKIVKTTDSPNETGVLYFRLNNNVSIFLVVMLTFVQRNQLDIFVRTNYCKRNRMLFKQIIHSLLLDLWSDMKYGVDSWDAEDAVLFEMMYLFAQEMSLLLLSYHLDEEAYRQQKKQLVNMYAEMFDAHLKQLILLEKWKEDSDTIKRMPALYEWGAIYSFMKIIQDTAIMRFHRDMFFASAPWGTSDMDEVFKKERDLLKLKVIPRLEARLVHFHELIRTEIGKEIETKHKKRTVRNHPKQG